MNEWSSYRKKQLQDLRPYQEGEPLTGVSISEEDAKNGSPKLGDFIARNVNNYNDQCLVSAKFVEQNYELAK